MFLTPSHCSSLPTPSSVRLTALVLQLDREVDVFLQSGHKPGEGEVGLRVLLGWAADDEGRPRFVDEDVVDLVDDGVVELALHRVVEVGGHVVAQVVEAELIIGAVGDIGLVGLATRDRRYVLHVGRIADLLRRVEKGRLVLEAADAQAEGIVDGAHPLRVALRQVVVDGDEMGAVTFEGVEVRAAAWRRASCPRRSSSPRSCPDGGRRHR